MTHRGLPFTEVSDDLDTYGDIRFYLMDFPTWAQEYDIFNSGAFAYKPGPVGSQVFLYTVIFFLEVTMRSVMVLSSILRPMKLVMLLVLIIPKMEQTNFLSERYS